MSKNETPEAWYVIKKITLNSENNVFGARLWMKHTARRSKPDHIHYSGVRIKPPTGADGGLLQRSLQRSHPLHRLCARQPITWRRLTGGQWLANQTDGPPNGPRGLAAAGSYDASLGLGSGHTCPARRLGHTPTADSNDNVGSSPSLWLGRWQQVLDCQQRWW